MSEATGQVAYGPCGDCGLVHGSWQECRDEMSPAERILKARKMVSRVVERGNVTDPQDAADLAAVLDMCPEARAPF